MYQIMEFFMKKLALSMLAFLFLLFFCGCGSSPPEMKLHIYASYSAEYEGIKLQGLLIYSETGEMYLDISTPDELSSLSFSWNEDFTMGYRGLNAMTEKGYLPDTSFGENIKNVFDDLRLKDYALNQGENDSYFAKCENSDGKYEVFTDRSGYITELRLEDFTVKLNNQHKNARQ